jgi:Spy/CpxP family protein refolding chaperone
MAPTAATAMATMQASKKALIAVLPKTPGSRESLHKMDRRGQRCQAWLKELTLTEKQKPNVADLKPLEPSARLLNETGSLRDHD